MAMMKKQKEVSIFDTFRLILPPKLRCHADGVRGHRVLFLTDAKETFTVSFEERMQLQEYPADREGDGTALTCQWEEDGKSLCQRRSGSLAQRCAFFRIGVKDDDDTTLYLYGQMVVFSKYQWSEGVEPVLLDVVRGLSLYKRNGGGTS